MRPEKIAKISGIIKTISDPTRLRILDVMINSSGGLCVGKIAEAADLSHSAASHQLSKLEAKEIVFSERDGQEICYFLENNAIVKQVKKIIKIFN